MTITSEEAWVAIGLIGQAMFFGRFVVQWIASERAGRSVIPFAFWFFSVAGGLIVLVYAIYRLDPVFIIGNTTGLFIYGRNIFLIVREKRNATPVNPLAPDRRAPRRGLSSGRRGRRWQAGVASGAHKAKRNAEGRRRRQAIVIGRQFWTHERVGR